MKRLKGEMQMKLKHIIYCISLIIVAICAFILGKMQTQTEDRPTMIGLKTDGIVIKDGIWIGIECVATST